MWSREELKTRAKTALRGNYWQALVISLLIAIASGSNGSGGVNFRHGSDSMPSELFPWIIPVVLSFVSLALLLGLAFRIFLG